MKVSGFAFCRNVVKYDYPVVESIRSILPIIDEFIANVDRCDDYTLDRIRWISDPKINASARRAPRRNRWLNWNFCRKVARRGFRG